jgi:glucan phosphoethanolaminetransferase (alkaline phosphatase superfamily)
MENRKSSQLELELIWWVFTLILAIGVLYPITSQVKDYPFLVINIFFIIVFVTFTRYVFLLKHTFIAKKQLIKLFLILLCLPTFLYTVNGINFFQTYIDENGFRSVVGDLPYSQQDSMMKYIRSLLLFFGVGGAIVTVVFAIRLIISVWRYRNHKRV